jgi:WD40 repeat protein
MSPVMPRLLIPFGVLLAAAVLFSAAPAQDKGDKGDKVKQLDAHGDPLPEGALNRIGSIRLRHNGGIGLLSFAADGKSLLSLGGDQTFRRWDVATGKELSRFEKKGLTIYLMPQVIERGGRFLGGGGMVVGGRMIIDQYMGEGPPSPAAYSADGKILATLDTRNAALLIDTATGKTIRKYELKENQGHSLALTTDGKVLAVSEGNGEDNYVHLWDVPGDRELPNLKLGKQRMANKLLFSDDGKMLASIMGGQIRLWDVTTGKRARLYEGHENIVTGIAFSSDGKYLASAGADGTVRVWETGSEEEVKKLAVMDKNFTSVALSADGKYVLAGSDDQHIYRWNLTNDECKPLDGHTMAVTALAVSPDGATLASADFGGGIRLWDLETCKEKNTVKQPERLHGFGVGTGEGGRSLSLWTAAGKVRHVDTLTGVERDSVKLPTDEGLLVEVAPDGSLACLISRGEEEGLRIWDGIKGQVLHTIAGHPGGTSAASFSPDSKLLVTSGADGTIRVWHAVSGKEVLHIANVNGMGVTFSPDGKLLAIQCDEDVCLFEMATGKERCRLRAPGSANSAMCFSPDSKLLTTNSGDEVIRLWDVVHGKLLRGLIGHQGSVATVAFAPRGDVLASGSSDGTVRLWKVSSGEELRSFEGHQGSVQRVVFADDGRLIISAASDNCVIVWDAASRPAVRAADPVAKKLDVAWAGLASDDGMVAFRAMSDLIGMPKETPRFLATKLQPVPVVDPAMIRQLVDDLDSKSFNLRQRATKDLEKLEGQARLALEKSLAKPPSAEAQSRIKKLLERLDGPLALAEDFRTVRAVEVLERIGTVEARDLLGRLAKGAPGARLTREASDSLARLKR